MPRAFISHITEDQEIALRLKQALKRDFSGHLDVFDSSDTESIAAGEEWLKSIDTALRKSEFVMVLCSPESVSRPWINFEAGAAWMRRIPLIPICYAGLRPRNLPMPLSLRQGIAIDNAEDLQRLYKRIASVLKCELPAISFDELARELKVNIAPRLIVELDTSAETLANKLSYPAMLYGIGKIPNPKVPHRSEEEDRLVETQNRSHIPLYFIRARITNKAASVISSCDLYVTGINSTRADLPFPRQELRWANTWFFEADPARNVVLPRGDVRPQHIDPSDSCHCDVCFYYDLQGPESVGEFIRGRVYLAVNRLPSVTYSLEQGTHLVDFQLAARYSDGTSVRRDLSFKVNIEMRPDLPWNSRVTFLQTT